LNIKRWIGVSIVLAVLVSGASLVTGLIHYRNLYLAATSESITLHQEVDSTRNQNMSLDQVVASLGKEVTHLTELLGAAKTPNTKIEYVIQTQTKLVPMEPIVVYPELPSEYTFKLSNGIVVAKFEQTPPDKFAFITYELQVRNTLVIGEDKSAVSTQVASSQDGIWHDVPSELIAASIDQPRYHKAAVQLGLGASSTYMPALRSELLIPELVVTIPWLHATQQLDLLTPGITIGKYPYASLYMLGYNIGKPIPLVDDLWLSAGASLDTYSNPGATVALTTKL
jgi:hypothetical protein